VFPSESVGASTLDARTRRTCSNVGADIDELDVNLLMVLPKGRGVLAVDALVVPRLGAP
jgi:hypothetical protein